MKIHNLYIALGLSVTLGLGLASCSSDDSYDVKGNPADLVFLNKTAQKEFTGVIYHTPVGDLGSAKACFPAQIQRPTTGDVTVGVVADTSFVAKYNENHGTSYVSAPDDVLGSLKVKKATIKQGEYISADSVEVEVPQESFAKLTAPGYVIPLKLSPSGAVGSEDQGVAYLIVNTSGNFLKFKATTATTSVVNTPVGVFGGIDASFTPSAVVELGVEATVSLKADLSLVDAYNQANNTQYQTLPDNVASALSVTPATIPSTSTQATGDIKVTASDDVAKTLALGSYLLPLRPVVTANGKQAELDEPVYVIVNVTQSLINDDAKEILGSEVPGDDMTCVSADGLDASNFSTSNWNFTQKQETASCVLDLGSERDITGFLFGGDVINNTKVEVSSDNKTWTSLGSTDGHSGVSVKVSWYNYTAYVLYGAVKGRYVRATMNLNQSYWGWNYIQWGYCSIAKLAIYAQ